eukprot:10047036-Ditylum_brightwellii.AAC.2
MQKYAPVMSWEQNARMPKVPEMRIEDCKLFMQTMQNKGLDLQIFKLIQQNSPYWIQHSPPYTEEQFDSVDKTQEEFKMAGNQICETGGPQCVSWKMIHFLWSFLLKWPLGKG